MREPDKIKNETQVKTPGSVAPPTGEPGPGIKPELNNMPPLNHVMPGPMGQGPPLGAPGSIPGRHPMPPYFPPGGAPPNFGPQDMPLRPPYGPLNQRPDTGITTGAQMLDNGSLNLH